MAGLRLSRKPITSENGIDSDSSLADIRQATYDAFAELRAQLAGIVLPNLQPEQHHDDTVPPANDKGEIAMDINEVLSKATPEEKAALLKSLAPKVDAPPPVDMDSIKVTSWKDPITNEVHTGVHPDAAKAASRAILDALKQQG